MAIPLIKKADNSLEAGKTNDMIFEMEILKESLPCRFATMS